MSSWNEVFRNTTVSENYWTNETLENRFCLKFPAYYKQINVIRSKLIWTSWRPHLKIWTYGLKFLGVFTLKRPLLKTLTQTLTLTLILILSPKHYTTIITRTLLISAYTLFNVIRWVATAIFHFDWSDSLQTIWPAAGQIVTANKIYAR